ncbi:MAG: DUF1788 domain-containing protein, partial [Dehalococcoidia bacterium]
MTSSLAKRLDQILPRITDETFLRGDGIGNEIACYIFDYPASEELVVRAHVNWLTERLESKHSALDVLHLDLLDVAVDYLEKRGLFDKSLELESEKGGAALLKALRGPLSAEKISQFIDAEHRPSERDLILLTGVGRVWPLLRAHSLLNCLHPVIRSVPLVMFYPGSFDGTTLRLFRQIDSTVAEPGKKPYYRA